MGGRGGPRGWEGGGREVTGGGGEGGAGLRWAPEKVPAPGETKT